MLLFIRPVLNFYLSLPSHAHGPLLLIILGRLNTIKTGLTKKFTINLHKAFFRKLFQSTRLYIEGILKRLASKCAWQIIVKTWSFWQKTIQLNNSTISEYLAICSKGVQCYLCTKSVFTSHLGRLNNTGWVWFIIMLCIYKFVTTNMFNCHNTIAYIKPHNTLINQGIDTIY